MTARWQIYRGGSRPLPIGSVKALVDGETRIGVGSGLRVDDVQGVEKAEAPVTKAKTATIEDDIASGIDMFLMFVEIMLTG